MKKTICAIMVSLVALLAVSMLVSCDGDGATTSSTATTASEADTGSTASTFKPTESSDVSVESNEAGGLQSFDAYDPGVVC